VDGTQRRQDGVMNDERFDGLAKALAHDVPRRHLLTGLLAGVAGLALCRGEAQAPPAVGETLSASGAVTRFGLPRAQGAALPSYPGAGSRTIEVSGLTQAWCADRGGHFVQSAGTCGDATTLCGEFTAAWARSCISRQGVFYESGCVPCLF
jgi:hypothetical protein